jgi:hypothetical protein
MDSEQDVNFRLRLAEGFLREAEEDLTLSRWLVIFTEESHY